MGKVLGGGSSVNLMAWVRGHKNDWDYFASEADDPAWNYESVLNVYKKIEDWRGDPEPGYRGQGGPVFLRPAHRSVVSRAFTEGASSLQIPTFPTLNGRMMEGIGGCSTPERINRDGRRQSIFRAYTYPYMDRPNLTVVTDALITRLIIEGKRTTGVEFFHNNQRNRIDARLEVVLSLGAINTPRVLMHSGIGDEDQLRKYGIPLVQHLPGVGQNFQDHLLICGCIWEYDQPVEMESFEAQAFFFWKSESHLDTPDLQVAMLEGARTNAATSSFNPPPNSWTVFPGVVRPKSRGQLRLTGSSPTGQIEIEANTLSDPSDLKAMIACVALCREIAATPALRPFVKREIIPGGLKGSGLVDFVRDSTVSYWHQSCTAKMGRDALSVVDSRLRVYGIENLRIADASIMPRVTTGNTMAPCVVIGERASEVLRRDHKITV